MVMLRGNVRGNYGQGKFSGKDVVSSSKSRSRMVLCEHLEGWDREGGRETQEGGDMGIYVYV